MHLVKALELSANYSGIAGVIRVDVAEYICLNDLVSFFPGKRLDHWLANDQTKELVNAVEKSIIPGKSGIIAKKGKGGGTYAHHLIALDFAAWLSVEFKIKVYEEYINGTQHKKDWNIRRILSAFNFKIMTKEIKNAHEAPKPYHFSNEALMINEIVFGDRSGDLRDCASEDQLDQIATLEGHNATMIGLGMEYKERKEKLKMFFDRKSINQIK